MKVYVIAILEDDGACGDDECCGGPSYHVRIDKVFIDEVKAARYLESLQDHRAGIHEIEIDQ